MSVSIDTRERCSSIATRTTSRIYKYVHVLGGQNVDWVVASRVLRKLHPVDVLNRSDEAFGGWIAGGAMCQCLRLSCVCDKLLLVSCA
jgi:hypothetical protein